MMFIEWCVSIRAGPTRAPILSERPRATGHSKCSFRTNRSAEDHLMTYTGLWEATPGASLADECQYNCAADVGHSCGHCDRRANYYVGVEHRRLARPHSGSAFSYQQ